MAFIGGTFTHETRFPDGTPKRVYPPGRGALVVFLTEANGQTGVYRADAETGDLYPCRTIDPADAEHHARVLAAWKVGSTWEDRRTK